MQDRISLRDVVQTEVEQLERYGEAAEDFFHELSDEIRSEFTGTLEDLLTHDLAAFQRQVNRTLAYSGMNEVGGILGDALGGAVESLIPGQVLGDVFGAAVGGALRMALSDFSRSGSVDMNRIIKGANKRGGSRLDSLLRGGRFGSLHPAEMPLSESQRGVESWASISKARRNL